MNSNSNSNEFFVGVATISGIAWRSAVPVRAWTKLGTLDVCTTADEAREAAVAGEFWSSTTLFVGQREEGGSMSIIDTLHRGYEDDPTRWESGAPSSITSER